METRKRWTMVIVGIVMSFMIGISVSLAASDYPTRYIDIVIPYGPGGATDVTVRLFKDKIEKLLGQPVVTVYKPGAGGVIAGTYVKKAKPDGYTLLVISNSSMTLSMLTRKAGFTIDDFAPVCTLTLSPIIFCVNKNSPYKTMKDFVEAAKIKKLKYTSTGAYSPGQMFIEAIGSQAGFQAVLVPGGGGTKAMTAVLGGHVDLSATAATGMESQLRVIAVVKNHRWDAYPDVPTVKEMGYPIDVENYFSLWAPKGTPKDIIDKLYGAHKKAFEDDRVGFSKRVSDVHQIATVLDQKALDKITRYSYDFFKDMVSKMGPSVK